MAEVSQMLEMESVQRTELYAQGHGRYRFTPVLLDLFKALESAHTAV